MVKIHVREVCDYTVYLFLREWWVMRVMSGPFSGAPSKTLKWKDVKLLVRLSCTKQMGSARSSMYYNIRTLSIVHLRRLFDVNIVGGANVVCFVSLLIHRAIHSSLWTSQTSADHEQGAWSATGARSLVKWCAHFIDPLLGNAQYGIACFLSTQNNRCFSKISFSKLIPLIPKILRL